MSSQRREGRGLLDKGRAGGIDSEEAIEMDRGHARIAGDHIEIRRIDFPQCDGAFATAAAKRRSASGSPRLKSIAA